MGGTPASGGASEAERTPSRKTLTTVARRVAPVLEGAVDHARVVEGGLARPEFNRHGPELFAQLLTQHGHDRVHVTGESGDGEVGPEVAAGHVVDAAVLKRRVVESGPAGEVRERGGARPVGVVLVPGDDAAVARGLAEELVV